MHITKVHVCFNCLFSLSAQEHDRMYLLQLANMCLVIYTYIYIYMTCKVVINYLFIYDIGSRGG